MGPCVKYGSSLTFQVTLVASAAPGAISSAAVHPSSSA